MAALIFWGAVVVIVLFLQLTTPRERSSMWSSFWTIIVIMGALGFAWQLLRQGTISS